MQMRHKPAEQMITGRHFSPSSSGVSTGEQVKTLGIDTGTIYDD